MSSQPVAVAWKKSVPLAFSRLWIYSPSGGWQEHLYNSLHKTGESRFIIIIFIFMEREAQRASTDRHPSWM